VTGSLTHPPAEIIGQLLVDLSVGTNTLSADWAVFIESEPDTPDESITVFDTANTYQGTIQISGETQEFHGIQVRVRGGRYSTAWAIVNDVAVKMDTQVKRDIVTLSSSTYNVHGAHRTSGPIHLGRESPQSKREIFTLNYLVSIRQVT